MKSDLVVSVASFSVRSLLLVRIDQVLVEVVSVATEGLAIRDLAKWQLNICRIADHFRNGLRL